MRVVSRCLLVALLLQLACVALAQTVYPTPNCAGQTAPYGCVSAFATFSNPVSTNAALTCYYGRPGGCSGAGSITCPCPGTDATLQASATSSPPGYPMQIRWGCASTDSGKTCTGVQKSGFGFRATAGSAVAKPGELFYFGLVAHLNYGIYGGAVSTWNLNMAVTLQLPNGQLQYSTFTMPLGLNETVNYGSCGTNTACKGSAYWSQFPNEVVRPSTDCVPCGMTSGGGAQFQVGNCNSGGTGCCPYRTPDASSACSDRVLALSSFSASSDAFTVNGVQYQVYIAGFAVPNTRGTTSRTYFISQEDGATEAELWGKLVAKCPASGTCKGDYVLSADGLSCSCDCSTTPACTGGQEMQADCTCACPAASGCRTFTKTVTNNVCVASCVAGCCPAPQVFVTSATAANPCQCGCPADSTCPYPNDQVRDTSTAACTCRCAATACPIAGQVRDATTCACTCPACDPKGKQVVDTSSGACACTCPANSCAAPFVLKAGDIGCGCQCANVATCTPPRVLNTNDCSCTCPSCPSPKLLDPATASSTCQCLCPACTNANKVVLSNSTCSCGCPTKCPGVQVQSDATCGCSCPSCPGAQAPVPGTGSACACECAACQGSQVLVNPTGTDCACACPANSCSGKQILDSSSGAACSCVCPTCPTGLVPAAGQTDQCECVCPSGFCPAGKVLSAPTAPVASVSSCACTCDPTQCAGAGPGSQVVDLDAAVCQCSCPTDYCNNGPGGALVDAAAPVGSCSCACLACSADPTSSFVQSSTCGCSCPLTQDDCALLSSGNDVYTFNASTCTCQCHSTQVGGSCGCKCTPQTTDCYTVDALCAAGDTCPRLLQPVGTNCTGPNDACTQHTCSASGSCVQAVTNCAPTLAAVPAVDRTCYSVACDPAAGCTLAFTTDASCARDLSAEFGNNAQCYSTGCTAANSDAGSPLGKCNPLFVADAPCTMDLAAANYSAADQQCLFTKCSQAGGAGSPGCVVLPLDGSLLPCSLAASDMAAAVGAEHTQCFSSQCGQDASGAPRCVPAFQAAYACSIDLAEVYGADNAQCFTVACDEATGALGGCKATFHDGQSCVLASLAADEADAQCFAAVCSQNQCLPVFDGARTCARNLTAEYGAVAAQCFSNECAGGACADVFAADAPCSLSLAQLAPSADDAQCFEAFCLPAAQTCGAVFNAALPCSLADLGVCHSASCVDNGCRRVFEPSNPCAVNASAPEPACFRSGCTEQGCAYLFDAAQAGAECALDLSAVAPDAASQQCYTAECVAPAGCSALFHANASCALNLTAAVGANNETCFTSQCTDGGCRAVFNPDGFCFEGSGQPAGDVQCYRAQCSAAANGCVWVAAPDAACSDGDACTIDATLRDPVTGSQSDRCQADAVTGSMQCVGSVSPCVYEFANKRNITLYECIAAVEQRGSGRTASASQVDSCARQVDKAYPESCLFKCFSDATGQFCIDPCGVPASKSKSDKAAIIAGVVVGGSCCFFALAVLVFGYVKWGHQRLMNLLHFNDFGANALTDSAIYEGHEGQHSSALHSPGRL